MDNQLEVAILGKHRLGVTLGSSQEDTPDSSQEDTPDSLVSSLEDTPDSSLEDIPDSSLEDTPDRLDSSLEDTRDSSLEVTPDSKLEVTQVRLPLVWTLACIHGLYPWIPTAVAKSQPWSFSQHSPMETGPTLTLRPAD